MQTAVLNLALEQLETATTQASTLSGLAERLEHEEFTMDLALEADRLWPQLRAADLYFSARSDKHQLAMENLVRNIWDAVVRIFQAIVRWIKSLFSGSDKSADVEKKAKEAEKQTATVQEKVQEVKQQAQKARVGNLDQYVDNYVYGEGKDSALAQLLGNAHRYVRAYLQAANGSEGYGRIVEEYLSNMSTLEQYVAHDLTKEVEDLRLQLANLAQGKPVDRDLLQTIDYAELELSIHGIGKVKITEANRMLQTYSHATAPGPVSFKVLREGLYSSARPKLGPMLVKYKALTEALDNIGKNVEKLISAISALADESVDESYYRQLRTSGIRFAKKLTAIHTAIEGFQSYVNMVKLTAHYFDQVMSHVGKLVDQELQKVSNNQATDADVPELVNEVTSAAQKWKKMQE